MITEDYVSFKMAKLLKEKGFNVPCECFYDTENNDVSIVNGWMDISNSELEEKESACYSAPTLQMVMKWLREVHKIDIDIRSNWKLTPKYHTDSYQYRLHYINAPNYDINYRFNTYEEAAEAGIKYCLENLI